MSEWMTAREAAKLLRVTERMIGHYAAQGKLQVKREGRRVWYFSEDVQKLAGTLQTDLRPQQISRQDVNQGLIQYIQESQQTGQQLLERLDRIEAQLGQPEKVQPQPRGPSWQVVATLAIVLAIALVVLAIVVRLT
jgi:DNA-binding transcriptional MerR regulator